MAAKEGEARVDGALGHLLEQGEIGEGNLTQEAVRRVLEEGGRASCPGHADRRGARLAGGLR